MDIEIYVAATAIHVLFTIIETINPWFKKFFPIGGSHIAQLGIVLGAAHVVHEFYSVVA